MGKGGELEASRQSSSWRDRIISADELEEKSGLDECWVAYKGDVYDATHWLSKHPGGARIILNVAGSDCTAVMTTMHAPDVLEKSMKRMRRVGKVELTSFPPSVDRKNQIEQDFNDLEKRLIRDGWYAPSSSAYVFQVIRVISFIVCAVSLCLWGGQSNVPTSVVSQAGVFVGAVLLGLYFQNVAFLGHDAGHGSITGKFSSDMFVGIFVGNLASGIGMGWWKSTHHVHHGATNSLNDDPDIQHLPLLCVEDRMTENRWSTYHGRYMPFDVLVSRIVPFQHLYYYPLMAVARVNLYVQTLIHLARTCPYVPTRPSVSKQIEAKSEERIPWPKASPLQWNLEVLGLTVFYSAFVAFLSSLRPDAAVMTFLVSHVVAGVLHVQICLSHLTMDFCTDGSGKGARTVEGDFIGFQEWQAQSTMDIACPTWMDWFHGGLQFQLEHHMFPRLPRYKLRQLMPLVDEILHKHGIQPVRKTFFEANRIMIKQLRDSGRRAGLQMTHPKKSD